MALRDWQRNPEHKTARVPQLLYRKTGTFYRAVVHLHDITTVTDDFQEGRPPKGLKGRPNGAEEYQGDFSRTGALYVSQNESGAIRYGAGMASRDNRTWYLIQFHYARSSGTKIRSFSSADEEWKVFTRWNNRYPYATEPTGSYDIVEGPESTGSRAIPPHVPESLHGRSVNERADIDMWGDPKADEAIHWETFDGTWQAAFLTPRGLSCLTVEKVTAYKGKELDAAGWPKCAIL